MIGVGSMMDLLKLIAVFLIGVGLLSLLWGKWGRMLIRDGIWASWKALRKGKR